MGVDPILDDFETWEHQVHVIFVCTGNICRSPIAERLAVELISRTGATGFRISSAGTRAVVGSAIHHEAARVLRSLGGDASQFAARQLTAKVVCEADLVLTMTRAHRDKVLELAPRQLRRTFTVAEAARLASEFGATTVAEFPELRPQLGGLELPDVIDPIGQSAEVFDRVGAHLSELLPPVVSVLARTLGTADAETPRGT